MGESSEVQTTPARASPWPIPLVLGLTVAELGVVFNVLALSVGGVVLLGGSVVGIFRESGYAHTLWRPSLGVGAVFSAFGGLVLAFTGADARGAYLLGGGLLFLAAAAVLALVETERL